MASFIAESVYITRAMLDQAQADFRGYYFADRLSGFPDTISIDWADLYNYLTANAIGQQGITSDNLVIRFIHRYDGNAWYLTALCGIKSNPVVNPDGSTTYNVADTAIFFKLADGQAIAADSDPTYYAADYFNNFYFQTAPGTMVNLGEDDPGHTKYIGNVQYPWKAEIAKLCFDNGYCDANGAPNYTTGQVSLKISSVSFTPDYPHGTILNLNVNGQDLVGAGPGTTFKDMAADFASMCPPNCSVYTQPAEL